MKAYGGQEVQIHILLTSTLDRSGQLHTHTTLLPRKGPPQYWGKGKGTVHPRTGHEGPEWEQRYSSPLSLTSALVGVGGQHHAPAILPPGKRPCTDSTGGWVSPRAGLGRCGKSRPHRDRSLDRLAYSKPLYRLHYPSPPPVPSEQENGCAPELVQTLEKWKCLAPAGKETPTALSVVVISITCK
jgi:hypothetical protein